MSNFRVIVSGNSGDGFSYRIEDVYPWPEPGIGLFMEHVGGLCVASSLEDLKRSLREMLKACDLPVLTEPAPKLVEASSHLQK